MMKWNDISEERYLDVPETKNVIEEWNRCFGGFEPVKYEVLQKIYSVYLFDWHFQMTPYVINSTVYRYKIIEHLIYNGALDEENLKGNVLDIASFLGAAVDALSAFKGHVRGTDSGKHAYDSPGRRDIGKDSGENVLLGYTASPQLNMVSFFNLDCDCNSGSVWDWHKKIMPALADGGEMLLTLPEIFLKTQKNISDIPDSKIIKLQPPLNKFEKYVFTAKKVNHR